MFLILIGLAFLFISTFFVYKTAKENGYNAVLWAIASFATFIVVFFGVAFLMIMILVLGISQRWKQDTMDGISTLADILSFAASIVSVMLILRHVNQIKDEDPFIEELPPLPTDFNIND